MRVIVALAVEVGIIALALQGAVTGVVAVTALLLAPAGYAFSYVRRARPSIVLKVLLAAGLLVATMGFLRSVRSITTVDAARVPLAALCLGSAVFLAMPRLPASLVRTPPFTLGHRTPTSSSTDAVTNPGLPSAGGDGVVDFAPLGYPGFSSTMDLRARGALSDQIVFRVRADQPELWRAEAFDTYDGSLWTASDTTSSALSLDADTQSFEPGYPP